MAARLASADRRPRPVPVVLGSASRRRTPSAGARAAVAAIRAIAERRRSALAQVIADAEGGPTVAMLARQRVHGRIGTQCGVGSGSKTTQANSARTAQAVQGIALPARGIPAIVRQRPHRRFVNELKALQDTLGEFQDGEVQREGVPEFAAPMMEQGAAPP